MNTLFLDFASHRQQFALIGATTVVGQVAIDNHTEEAALMPKLEGMLAAQQLMFKDITQIACVIGPGGFTSIRVGVAMANALSYGLKIPNAGVHLSDLWGKTAQSETKDFLWLHSTRKTALFVRGFGTFAKKWPEPTLISIDQILAEPGFVNPGYVHAQVVGELIPEHQERLKSSIRMLAIESFDSVLPVVLNQLHYQENQTLLPWYGREA